MTRIGLGTVLREWGRIGCLGFGGPPAHIAMLRELTVNRRGWVQPDDFERAVTATSLLPGPASTQLSILLAHRVAGVAGAIVGGLAFILPGLVLIIVLAAIMLSGPPDWVLGAGAGAAAAVPLVAVQAGRDLVGPSRVRAAAEGSALRWPLYAAAGLAAAVILGPWLVLVLIGCGVIEIGVRGGLRGATPAVSAPLALVAPLAAASGLGALAWTAFKVGALSYGGGFVIVPLMRSDALDAGWMTGAEFSSAVALGQITPGPVVHTVAAVGYGAHGVGGALLAAAIAFLPSFVMVVAAARQIEQMRASRTVAAFMDGAGPAAIGGIFGAAVTLASVLETWWQFGLAAITAILLLGRLRSVVAVLLLSGLLGTAVVLLGAPLPDV